MVNKMNKRKLAISIIIPLVLGAFIGFISDTTIYENINRPALSPPGYIFPIVWTILYILMGISSYLIWTSKSEDKKEALKIYGLQLFVNLTWSLIFFNLKSFSLALIWILLLVVLVIIMIIKFYRINKFSGIIQIPYLLWTLFATYLTYMVYTLN